MNATAPACLCMALIALGCAGRAPEPAAAPPLPALAEGAKIAGANGLQFGPDGLLYVASVFGDELVVVDPETGSIVGRISEGVDSPDDLAFSSDGSVYWTSILTGEVAGLRPDGTRVTAARLTPGVNPITFSPDDRLFVSQCFFDDKLYEVDPAGIKPPRLISDQLGPHCGLNGMDWGPDGRLYGPRWFRGEVVSFDVDTGTMRLEASGFQVPAAVKFDSRGRLHVLDSAAGTVVRIEGKQRVVVATLEPGLDNLAFDAEDRLFVSSYADGSISRIESNGKISRIVRGGLTAPGGLALLENAGGAAKGGTDVEVVVADVQSIRGFDGKSGVQRLLQRSVFGTGQMGSVTNVAPDGANLILSSWLDGTVTVWDPTARRVVSRTPDLAQPVSAIRYGRWIVVAEYGKGRVIAISPSDPLKTVLFVSGLPAPTGLAVRNGDLFVTDRVRGEILRIASGGVPVRRAAAVASGLASPEGIAATPTGFVVVEGDTGRLIEIDTHGQVRVVETIPGGTREAPTSMQPPSMIFNGVAVSREGVIYATGEKSRALYRIDPH